MLDVYTDTCMNTFADEAALLEHLLVNKIDSFAFILSRDTETFTALVHEPEGGWTLESVSSGCASLTSPAT